MPGALCCTAHVAVRRDQRRACAAPVDVRARGQRAAPCTAHATRDAARAMRHARLLSAVADLALAFAFAAMGSAGLYEAAADMLVEAVHFSSDAREHQALIAEDAKLAEAKRALATEEKTLDDLVKQNAALERDVEPIRDDCERAVRILVEVRRAPVVVVARERPRGAVGGRRAIFSGPLQ